LLKDSFCSFSISGGVGGVDEEIIHVDDKPSLGNHISEGVVHELLKGGWGVHEAEKHHSWFEEAFVGNEGSFPLMAILDSNIDCCNPSIRRT